MASPATIELIGPSGYPDQEAIARALERLRQEGHRVGDASAAHRRFERFAGTDSERAADLNRLADPGRTLPDIVLAVRGGYGAVRLLHGLDYDGLKRRLQHSSTALVGHSDFTAIQLALLAKTGLVTFGGPMLAGDFGAPAASRFTMEHFWSTLRSSKLSVQSAVPQQEPVSARGILWGGNLAVIASLIGTPYMPRIDGGILFIEDVNEQPFRIERMIYQLHLAGILARQQALILGHFSGIRQTDYDDGYGLPEMIRQIRSVIGIPVLTGLQFGHVADLLTLPVGAPAELDAGADGFVLTVSGYPHLA
jgi:muramoyltetrapeptide carboxypeptidase